MNAQKRLVSILRKVLREMVIAPTMLRKSLRTRTISPVSIATSVPDPTAIPTLAWARAGASLMPSPTIATMSPRLWISLIFAAFSVGSTSAMTSGIPASRAIASAVFRLSPVSIMTLSFKFVSWRMAEMVWSLSLSAMPKTPKYRPSTTTLTVVFPPC
ncbi:MAG: hypothetical protein RBG13Loki_2290 [Promethearchaeota archaeon CR_4]|nr:MAG: hypothetical protein RBG13Loki_2290 [Candidatus Lokiarchaeota archaeon CR_4]